MNFRVVRNLVYDFVLGWDFLYKYKAKLNPHDGCLEFNAHDNVPLVPNTTEISRAHFCLDEDTTIPPLSKMHVMATIKLDPGEPHRTTDTVICEPLIGQIGKVAVARSISKVDDGRFMTELLNPFSVAMTIEEGTILGLADFVTDEEISSNAQDTGMVLGYSSEDSGYESNDDPKMPNMEAPPPKEVEKPKPTKPPDQSLPTKPVIDYSKIAEDAKPYQEELRNLLEEKHPQAFSLHERDRGHTDLINYHSGIKPGPPIAVPPYRTTPELQKVIDKEVHEMLADGLVSHSTSPYSAPVLVCPKKDGGWRFVTDFRKVNARCERFVYPLPRIEDALQRLKNPQFFSTLDLQKGFWQVPIAEADRKYFAFSTGTMHVEYNVMPMGALNSSSTLQTLMTLILRGLPPEHVICFLDDILIASSSMEDHLKHLDQVLLAIRRAGLKLNGKKCIFAREEIISLGHKLSREGISPDPTNIDKIKKWKTPISRTEVKQFLGLTGYYREWVEGYARKAVCLTNLTKNETPWVWAEAEQKAFEMLRNNLISMPIMAYPDFDKMFWIKCDASGFCVGHVLTQFHEKSERVIAYGSKKLTETQFKWITYDKEYFSVITAIRNNSHYLRHKHFKAITDHRPLLAFRKIAPKDDPTGRRIRWSNYLGLYDFELIYKKGKKHCDADALSRLDNHDDYAEEEELAMLHTPEEEEAIDVDDDTGDYALLAMKDTDEQSAVELIAIDEYREQLIKAQDEDHTLTEIKAYVRSRKHPPENYPDNFYRRNFNRFTIREGILYRKSFCQAADTPILQAVIPPSLVKRVLSDAHGHQFAGHPGYRKMALNLERHVTWPTIVRDCNRHVTKCPQCDRAKQQVPKPRTPLQPIVANYILEHVCVDTLELPQAPGSYRYVLLFEDVFSKYIWLYKVKDKTAATIVRALENLVSHVGVPTRLTSDNGTEFCNDLNDAATQLLGIKKATSVVRRPQSQGMVERNNKQFIEEMRKRLQQFGRSWTEHVSFIMLAYNGTTHTKTGVSPYLAFYGRDPPLPKFTDLSPDTLKNKSSKEYIKEFRARLEHLHDAVRTNTKNKVAKEKELYDRKVKHDPLIPGEKVYEINRKNHKLDPNWVGPIEVVRRRPNSKGQPGTTYECKYKDGSTCFRNYEQIKRAHADVGIIERGSKPVDDPVYPRWYTDSGSSGTEDAPPTPRPMPVLTSKRGKSATTRPSRPQVQVIEPVARRTRSAIRTAATMGTAPTPVATSNTQGIDDSTMGTTPTCHPLQDVTHPLQNDPRTLDTPTHDEQEQLPIVPEVATAPPLAEPEAAEEPPRAEPAGIEEQPQELSSIEDPPPEEPVMAEELALEAPVPDGERHEIGLEPAEEQPHVLPPTSPPAVEAEPQVQTPTVEDRPQDPHRHTPPDAYVAPPPLLGIEEDGLDASLDDLNRTIISHTGTEENASTMDQRSTPERRDVELQVFMEYLDIAVPSPEDDFHDLSSSPESTQGSRGNRSITFIENVGRRYITIMEHNLQHYRLDRREEKFKLRQNWVCRWAGKFTCNAQIFLTLEDSLNLQNYTHGELRGQHSHPPQALEASLPRPSTLELDALKDQSSISTNSTPNSFTTPEESFEDERNLSLDFRCNVMANQAQSSPIASGSRSKEDDAGEQN